MIVPTMLCGDFAVCCNVNDYVTIASVYAIIYGISVNNGNADSYR